MNWRLAVMDVFDVPEGYLHLFIQEGLLRVLCRLKRNSIYILILLSLLVVVARHGNSRTGRSPQKLILSSSLLLLPENCQLESVLQH